MRKKWDPRARCGCGRVLVSPRPRARRCCWECREEPARCRCARLGDGHAVVLSERLYEAARIVARQARMPVDEFVGSLVADVVRQHDEELAATTQVLDAIFREERAY